MDDEATALVVRGEAQAVGCGTGSGVMVIARYGCVTGTSNVACIIVADAKDELSHDRAVGVVLNAVDSSLSCWSSCWDCLRIGSFCVPGDASTGNG